MLEYASMRLTDSCRPAMRLATVIVTAASVATTGGHPAAHDDHVASLNDRLSTRSSIAKAPAFTATAMKVVAGVGAPSYASGVQAWNGTALTLKTMPTSTSTAPMTSTGLRAAPVCAAAPMPARSVWPVAP